MPTPPAAPLLDKRKYDDLVATLETRLSADELQPGKKWTPRQDGSQDVGGTLVRIFARMMEQLITRLNQVPEQHHRAFLDLLGVERLPPTAARVPLTFLPSAGSAEEPLVPAQTAVAAPAEGALPDAVYYTEEDLAITRTQLVAAFTYQPAVQLYEDVTAIATGASPGAFAAFGETQSDPCALLIACDRLLARRDIASLTFDFTFATKEDGEALGKLKWSYWDGHSFTALLAETAGVPVGQPSGLVTWELKSLPQLAPVIVCGQEARWLRASSPLPSSPRNISATAHFQPKELSPTLLFGGAALDLSRDFQPFGNSPKLYDTFYLCGGEEFLAPTACVTLHWTISDSLWAMKASTLTRTTSSPSMLSWEVWTGGESGEWTAVPPLVDDTSDLTFAGKTSPKGAITLKLPPAVASTTVDGVPGAWLRVRIVNGSYGTQAGGLGTPKPSQVLPKDSWDQEWSYVVVAIGASGTIQPSNACPAKGPSALDSGAFIQLVWPEVPSVAFYAVYRTQGPGPTTTRGFIGSTTGTLFVDAGQNAGVAPSAMMAPARPSLKSLTVDFGPVALASDASAHPLSDFAKVALTRDTNARPLFFVNLQNSPVTPNVPEADSQPALYLGFSQGFANRPMALFLELDAPTAEEVMPDAPGGPLPTLHWDYSTSQKQGFVPLAVEDETHALTRSGLVRFLGPADFAATALFGRQDCYWLRVRLAGELHPERRLRRVLTNTIWAVHARTLTNEILGSSDGSAGQCFRLSQKPVLLDEWIEVREVLGAEERWLRWLAVADFHGSGPTDAHYVIDRLTGVVRFGNGRSGRVPSAGAQNIRAAQYRTGGGTTGNRPALKLNQLRSSIASLQSAINYVDASGGSEAEEIEHLKSRSATVLRHGGRAVTVQDFEDLALAASPGVARARAIRLVPDPAQPQVQLQVSIVPVSAAERPVPGIELLELVRAFLQARSMPFIAVQVVGPSWLRVNVTTEIVAQPASAGSRVRDAVLAKLKAFLHPLTGNVDGRGWDFGRWPHASDLYRALAGIPSLHHIREGLKLVFDPGAADGKIPAPDGQAQRLIYAGDIEVILSQEAYT